MGKTNLILEVGLAAHTGAVIRIAATLALPENYGAGLLDLFVCLHAGTYTRAYWDAQIDGWEGYSFVDHMVAAGKAVLTFDMLGMGDSTQPSREDLLNPLVGAQTHHLALAQVMVRIKAGEFGADVASKTVRLTGVGHSMGGMMTIVQQAAFASFDLVAILGFTNIGLQMSDEVRVGLAKQIAQPGYSGGDRTAMRAYFHAPDVPEAVMAADDARASHTPHSYGRLAILPGGVAAEAAAITVPVYLHFADIDVSPDPHGEPALFRGSRHVTLTTLPGAAHCHNFASTRQLSWRALEQWVDYAGGAEPR